MDYLTYESFIHPDVLSAFLVKDADVTLTVSEDAQKEVEIVSVKNEVGAFAGDKFLFDNVLYTIRSVDGIRHQIYVNSLMSLIPVDTVLTIQKEDKRIALKNFYDIGVGDCNTFSNSLIVSGVQVRFDPDVYILKRAFIAMYSWMLQNKAFLRNLNLTGVGIAKSEIFQHFFDLLESEKKDLEAIRGEAMSEVARKQQNDADGKSGKGFRRLVAPNRSYFSGYRR